MTLTINLTGGNRRFDALLGGKSQEAHDQALLQRPDWIVAPTVGAIVPNWLLAIPRAKVLSFRDWARSTGERVESILEQIHTHLGLHPSEVIWFEHGPALAGTSVGCGLDHAHLHVLLRPRFSFRDFEAQARALSDLEWLNAPSGYADLSDHASYFIAGSGEEKICAVNVEAAGSQFFRRVIGTLSNRDAEWDYRRHSHADNIARTIQTFRALEGASKRGG